MTTPVMSYIDAPDIPEGMTIEQYRRSRRQARPTRRLALRNRRRAGRSVGAAAVAAAARS